MILSPMTSLLTDAIHSHLDLKVGDQGLTIPLPSSSKCSQITSINQWLDAFAIYFAVIVSVYASQAADLIAYQQLIRDVAPFQAKVEIMIYILDYQGFGKVFCLTGTGSDHSCGWCMQKGVYCKHLHKVVYPGNRRFLPTNHVLRKDCHNFPEHSEELRQRPAIRSFQQDISFHKVYGNAKNQAQHNRLASGTGCREMYVLASKNPSFDRVKQTVPDAMHTIAVQMKHLVRCIAGKAPEDSIAVRLQEKALDRFQDSWITASTETSSSSTSSSRKGTEKTENNTSQKEATSLPTAPFGLNNKQ